MDHRTWVLGGAAIAAMTVVAACDARSGRVTGGGGNRPATTLISTADPIPIRRAGLWEDKIVIDGKAMGAGARTCYGPDTDAKVRSIFGSNDRPDCHISISRGLSGVYTMTGACQSAQRGSTISKGTATGDFSSAYVMHVESTTTGAPRPAMNSHMVMDMTSHYLGACPAGMVAGDVVTDGMKINILKP